MLQKSIRNLVRIDRQELLERANLRLVPVLLGIIPEAPPHLLRPCSLNLSDINNATDTTKNRLRITRVERKAQRKSRVEQLLEITSRDRSDDAH